MADIVQGAIRPAGPAQAAATTADRWLGLARYSVGIGLVLVFLAVGFGLPVYLPLQAAAWLTFLALVITPGFLLGDLVIGRLDLDLLERLALAMPLGVFVMALPGMITMLGHLTIRDLALAWTLTVGCLIAAWLFRSLLLLQARARPAATTPSAPWKWDEIALLLLLVAAFAYMYPTLTLYKMDGDAYAVASFTADALTGRPINETEPALGTGRSVSGIRMGFNQLLPIFHLWSYFSGADHIELIGTASRSMLALWAMLASYALGKAAGNGSRRAGLLTASIQTLVFLAAPFLRSDHPGIFFFERINADKFTVTVTMLPVALALAIRYVRAGRLQLWIAAALAAFAVSSIHALIAAMLALALGAFGALHLVLHLCSRVAWGRVFGLAGVTLVVMILPLVQLYEARTSEPMAPTYPSTLEGWPIEQRFIPAFPFGLVPTLDVYGPLPDLAHMEAEQANTPTNPFLIWRFALNMRRQRIIVFDLNRYISDPTLILEPPYLLALLLLPLLLWRIRSDLGAQFAVSTSLAVLFVMFNPVLTPVLGSLVMPWILWRFVWLLPYALIVALVLDRWLQALDRAAGNAPRLRSGRSVLVGTVSLALVTVIAVLLVPNIVTNLKRMNARGAAPLAYPTPDQILAKLREETTSVQGTGSGPVMVMADPNLSVTIPAFVGNADIVAHRILSTSEMFPADQQDVALQRHIDQYDFYDTPLLTPAHIRILERYNIRYVTVPAGTSLDAQLGLSPGWFEWLVTDEGYSLYAVRELPVGDDANLNAPMDGADGTVAVPHPSLLGNAALLEHKPDVAQEHYRAALQQNPEDMLALVGQADFYRMGGQFDLALATLDQAAAQLQAQSSPSGNPRHRSGVSLGEGATGVACAFLQYRLGQVYLDVGQVERSIEAFDLAQRMAPALAPFHTALGDACLTAGHSECTREQFEAAVDTLKMDDEAERLMLLASVWQERTYAGAGANIATSRSRGGVALSLAEQAAALRPDQETGLLLAELYLGAEEFSKAEELLRILGRAHPPLFDLDVHLRILSARARLRIGQGEIDRAVALYRRAIWLQELFARDTRANRLALAQTLLDDGRLDQARREIERVLALQPHSAAAYVLLGNLYGAEYEPRMAMEAFQYAMRLDPTEAAAYVSLSDQYRQQATPPGEALTLMQSAVEYNPDQAILVLSLADQWRRLGDVDMAMATYQQALGWFESDNELLSFGSQPTGRIRALAYARLAALYEDLGQIDTAMNYYRAAATAAPGQPWALVTLGDALRRRNQIAEAENTYHTAIERDPVQVDAYLRLADLLADRGDAPTALEFYDRAVEAALSGSNPTQTSRAWLAVGSFYGRNAAIGASQGGQALVRGSDDELFWDADPGRLVTERALAAYYQALEAEENVAGVRALAGLYEDLGQGEQAIATYQKIIEVGEQERWVPSLLARYYVGLGDAYLAAQDGGKAMAALQRAVELDGWWSGAWLALARGYSEQGDGERALAEIQRAAEVAPGSVEPQLALAATLDEQGDGQRALTVYQAAAQAHPGNVAANLALARAWQERFEWQKAEQSYRQAMAMVPGDPETYLGLAGLELVRGHHDDAEALLHKALELDRTDQAAYLQLGDFLSRRARHAEALVAYEQARDVGLNAWQPYVGLAAVHLALGQIEQAERNLLEAAALQGTVATPFLELAGLYEAQNHPEKAEEILHSAQARLPGDAAIRQALADLYQSMGYGGEAVEQLRLAAEENPGSIAVLVSYGDLLRLQGFEEEAQEVYRQAEEALAAPGATGITAADYQALAAALQAQGRRQEALAKLDQALAQDPHDVASWVQKGQLQSSLVLRPPSGGGQEATPQDWVTSLDRATELGPAEGRTWTALGSTQLAAGRIAEAVKNLEQAIAVEPTYLPAYETLLEAYGELGVSNGQAQMLRVASLAKEVVPGTPLAYLYHARALESMQSWDAARNVLNEAFQLAPGAPEIYTAMAQLEQEQGNASEAASWYTRATDLRPGDPAAYLGLIDLQLSQGENLQALASSERAVEKRPGDSDLLLRLGRVQRVLGRYTEAEANLLRAAQLDPMADNVQAELALVHQARGQPNQAIAAYEQAIMVRPDQAAHHLALSQLWETQGRPEHALALLKAALPQVAAPAAGTSAPLYTAISDLYLRRGEPGQALGILEQGMQDLGQEMQILQAMAAYYQSQADFDRAEEYYGKVMELHPDEAASHLAWGGLLLGRGRADEALAEYQQAVDLEPFDGNALLALGNAQRLLGQASAAIASYSRALELAPTLEDAYIALAGVYQDEARWQEVQAVYERGLAVAPTSARLLMALSDLLLRRGDEEQALRLLDKAVQYSANGRTYIARSNLYRVLGRAADAQRDLETALWIEPGSVEVLAALGNVHRSKGNFAEAEDAYRRAISLQPGSSAPYLSLAELALARGETEEAWWQFEAAIQAEPASAGTLVNLAAARAQQGDWAEADEAYRRAIELDPTSTEAYLGQAEVLRRASSNLDDVASWLQQASGPGVRAGAILRTIGQLYEDAGQSARTDGYLQQAVEEEPASPEGYLALVELYLDQGRPVQAEDYAKLALEIAPHDPAVRISLGNIYHTLGDVERAESHYREAIALDATRLDGYTALAEFHRLRESYDEAVATYEEAISLAPADWSLWVSLGNLYAEMEEYSEALSAYEQASEMNPNAPEPWLGQGDVYVAREKWSAAQEAYEQAQRLRPNQIESLLRLANLYEERDNLSKARDYATKAIEVDPVSASGYVTLGRIQLARENASEAAEAYMSAIQRDPRRPAAYSSWMWCYTDIKRVPYRVIMDRLEDELEEIADSEDAGTVWAQALLGLGYLNLEEDPDRIIGHLEEAIRMDPNFVELYQELASLYEENGDTARALELWYRYLYATARTSDTSEIEEHIDLMLQGQIEQPAGGDSVSGSVEIIGTASGEKFLWYTVEYSASGSDTWSTIAKKESRVEHGTLATWNTAGLSPGEYRIRLEVIMAKSKDPSYEVTVEVQP